MRRTKCISGSFCSCRQHLSLSLTLRSQKIFKMNSKETDKFHNMSLPRLSSWSKANSEWCVNCRLQGIWYRWDELNDRVSPYKGRSLRRKGGVIILRGICSVYWNGFWQICGSVKYFETDSQNARSSLAWSSSPCSDAFYFSANKSQSAIRQKIVTLARSLTVPDTNFGTTPLPFARFLE